MALNRGPGCPDFVQRGLMQLETPPVLSGGECSPFAVTQAFLNSGLGRKD